MQPAAHVAAAIEVLDAIFSGVAPEPALKSWARGHRFAGSKDRAAIRDHVFQALRCRRSYGWLGGANTGRGVMLGAMRAAGMTDEVFTGIGHAPAPVQAGEEGQPLSDAPRGVQCDVPDWLLPYFDRSLGADADHILALMRHRAGVFLRVNAARITREDAARLLAQEGIETAPVPDVKFALKVTENERRISSSPVYLDGLVELQDASSQRAVEGLGDLKGRRVLDYCAGGGGKALALAALGAQVTAHDIDPRRMTDLPRRAERAGVTIGTVTSAQLASGPQFDMVLCDAPCSGSGTWRRDPAGKWAMTEPRFSQLHERQIDVLRKASPLVRSGGRLVYMTCSVIDSENSELIQEFTVKNSSFALRSEAQFPLQLDGDGFFTAELQRLT